MVGLLVPLAAGMSCGYISGGGAALFRAPPAQLPVVAPPPQPVSPVSVAGICSSAARWASTRFADDDALLAMASPHAYWLLREWRAKAFGQEIATRTQLQSVRRQLMKGGVPFDVLRGAEVRVRTKGLFSTFHKAVVRGQTVHDVLAVRVVLRRGLEDSAIFDAHAAIRKMWPTVAGRHKDYVSCPKANGYQAVHDAMVLPSGHPFELQIRTDAMHRTAEYGTAAHRRYKGALAMLPMAVMAGVARGSSERGKHGWPLQPEAAITLASKLADA